MSITSTFRQHSIEVVQRFLQTVVIVDDGAAYVVPSVPDKPLITPGDEQSVSDGDHKTLVEPGFEHAVAASDTAQEAQPAQTIDMRHVLDAKIIADAFADKGLVCSILRPEKGEIRQNREGILKRATLSARRSDLLVLDWQIVDDDGRIAKAVILRTLNQDDRRIRLIAIYTGENNLDDIVDSIASFLSENGFNGQVKRQSEEPYTLIVHSAKIEIFAKERSRTPQEQRKIAAVDLPNRLIESFSAMTAGLVSNMAIDAISSIRTNTHYLLSRLHKGLSGAYIVQRALTHPQDALEYANGLVAAELHSIFAAQGLEEEHDLAVDLWMKQYDDWRAGTIFSEFRNFNHDKFHQWVMGGLKITDELGLNDTKKKKLHTGMTKALLGSNAGIQRDELAMLTVLKPPYGRVGRSPLLNFGTIIAGSHASEGSDPVTEYLVCIQPTCDSVRLTETTRFPFLELRKVAENGDFTFVVKDGANGNVYLRIVNKTSAFQLLSFDPTPSDSGCVRANSTSEGDIYESKDGKKYRYIAELKEGFAQRIAHQFASHLSRVGLNEMEWLRLIEAKKWIWD